MKYEICIGKENLYHLRNPLSLMMVINTYIIFVYLLLVMLAAMGKYIISNNIHKYFCYVTGNENNRNFQERYISNFVKRLVDISWREV